MHNRTGLTNLLRGTHDNVTDLLQNTEVPGLRILTSGPLPSNPPDTLYSPSLHQVIAKLKEEADLILFDTPPLAVSDPFIIAGIVDGVLLVAWAGRTRRNEISSALERIGLSGTPVIGVILNRVSLEGEGYYYYYRSYYDTGSEPPVPPPSDGERRCQGGGARATARAATLAIRPRRETLTGAIPDVSRNRPKRDLARGTSGPPSTSSDTLEQHVEKVETLIAAQWQRRNCNE